MSELKALIVAAVLAAILTSLMPDEEQARTGVAPATGTTMAQTATPVPSRSL
jgi:hypothetical protein